MSNPLLRFYRYVRRVSKLTNQQWMAVVVLLFSAIAFLVIGYSLQYFNDTLATQTGDEILSFELAFDGNLAREIIERWRQAEVLPDATKSLLLDFLFIVIYTAFMMSTAFLARAPLRRLGASKRLVNIFWLMPLLPALLDVLENVLLLSMIHSDAGSFGIRAFLAGLFAVFKFIFVGLFWILGLLLARPAFKVLALVRFSLLMLAIGIVLLFVPQWLEVLRAVTEAQNPLPILWTALASLFAATSTWYSARVMYTFDWSDYAPQMKRMKKWLPRLIGFLMPFLVLIGYLKSDSDSLWLAVVVQLLAAVVFFLVVVFRRHLLTYAIEHFGQSKKNGLSVSPEPDSDRAKGWSGLPAVTRSALLILLVQPCVNI